MGKLQDRGKLGVFSGNVHAIVIVALPIVIGAWSMAFLLRYGMLSIEMQTNSDSPTEHTW